MDKIHLNVGVGALRAAAVLLAGLAVAFPVTNTDIWWHLAAGRWIVEHGSFPLADPFSAAPSNVPWDNVHWLFQLFVYAVHLSFGLVGLVAFKVLLIATATSLLIAAIGAAEATRLRWLVPPCLAAMIFASRTLIVVRPILFTLLFLSLFLLVLERTRVSGKTRMFIWLPVIQIIWVNSQGLHPLGPFLVACFAAGAALQHLARKWGALIIDEQNAVPMARPLGFALVATLGASLLSPYGWGVSALSLKLFARINPASGALFSQNVSENIPPWQLERLSNGGGWIFTIVAILGLVTFFLEKKRIVPSRFFIFAGLLLLGLMAHRNVLLFLWLGVPIACINLSSFLQHKHELLPRRLLARHPWLPLVTAFSFLVALTIPVISTFRSEPTLAEPAPFRVPRKSAEWLTEANVGGVIFGSVRYGGYLIWKLFPSYRPVIDGRLVLKSNEQFEEFLEIVDHPEELEPFRQRHKVCFAVLPTAFPNRYLRLIKELWRDPAWSLILTDGSESLFAHRCAGKFSSTNLGQPTAVAEIASEIQHRYPDAERVRVVALQNLSILLMLLEKRDLARGVLEPLHDLESKTLVARSYFLDKEFVQARNLARAVVESDPTNVSCLVLLATIAAERGEVDDAARWLMSALENDPYNPAANALLQRLKDGHERSD